MISSAQLRTIFLEFFRSRGHEVVPSSSLLPSNDPTLLFTNAGMVPFKDLFLGVEQRHYVRAASSQRCVRAGGKHNDLENVGYTARHHTFFEMLGNFSFGDYFKQEAIDYAWEFLTQTLAIPAEKLWITVYEEDDESAELWLKRIGIDPARLSRIGAEDNFWSMGDTGPCGPCSEIFYDHGPSVAGGPPGTPEGDGDRYVEIWNLVFMQYNRSADGTLSALPQPSVDTGMGLERLAAVLQGVHSNYDIDLFSNLIRSVMEVTGCSDRHNVSLKVVADHIRSCAFLITDGVIPSNEGRGYVLRRIIRRAIRHGHKLGTKEPFFFKLAQPLAVEMGAAYPELDRTLEQIQRVLKTEEARFAETLEQGLKQLESDIATLSESGSERTIPGETVFRLYDTYGFPADLTADIAREKGLSVDMAGFEAHMQAQRQRARATKQFDNDYAERVQIKGSTRFTGYQQLTDSATVIALYHDGAETSRLNAGQRGLVVTDSTPFYAESGGQVGDRGTITSGAAAFVVKDTQKQGADAHAHLGEMRTGTLAVGDHITAHVDVATRRAIALNHSATHLMHAALRDVLGEHVSQKGSLVDENRLRFDFSHFEAVTAEQLSAIEKRVNQQIRRNSAVETTLMSADDAVAAGATALFGEKYGDEVRVLAMGDFSKELCGGTHTARTGDIGLFKITLETGIAAGVRRIEALTGDAALDWTNRTSTELFTIGALLKAGRDDISQKVRQLNEKTRRLEKEVAQLKGKLASAAGVDLSAQAENIDGVHVLAARLDGVDPATLRDTVDQLKNKLGSAAIVLAIVNAGKVSLVAGVSKDQTQRIKAGDLVNRVAQQVGGKGGGRPDMAQAGGNDPAGLDAALNAVPGWVREQLSGSSA